MAEVMGSILPRTSFLSHKAFKGKAATPYRVPYTRSMPQITMQAERTVSFSSELSTDLPLYEPSEVPFEQYLSDRERIFQAIFPDKRRSEKLNDEEWRIHMLPIEFLFLTAFPVIDMSIIVKAPGQGYPPGISKNVKKVLTLEATRWELRGLDYVLQPSDFVLGVRGALYSENNGVRSRLKGLMEMTVSFVLPPALAVIPEDILKSIGHAVLIQLLENMKGRVNRKLLADYRDYSKEQKIASQSWREGQAIKPAL
uniref:Uncharacterized protein n=1 Tax=Picea sitchensis TaxID=3332 RepID=A9NZC5_PICSI|nr:unknown [Picea sitchensis]